MTTKPHSWLAHEIIFSSFATNAKAAMLMSKIERAPKLWLDEKQLINICNLKLKKKSVEEIMNNFELLNSSLWIESDIPIGHDIVFADTTMKMEAANMMVKFALLIEKEKPNFYYISHCCKTNNTIFCPLGLEISIVNGVAHWHTSKSRYFPEEHWETEIVQEMLPIAEEAMKASAAFFVNSLVLLGQKYYQGYSDFYGTIN